jgi:hypothetical protein
LPGGQLKLPAHNTVALFSERSSILDALSIEKWEEVGEWASALPAFVECLVRSTKSYELSCLPGYQRLQLLSLFSLSVGAIEERIIGVPTLVEPRPFKLHTLNNHRCLREQEKLCSIFLS